MTAPHQMRALVAVATLTAAAAAATPAAAATAAATAAAAAVAAATPPLLGWGHRVTPHLAKLLRVDAAVPGNRTFTFVCAGLLLTERHVLTTARCPYAAGEMTLLAGGGGTHLTDGLAFRVVRRVVVAAATTTDGDNAQPAATTDGDSDGNGDGDGDGDGGGGGGGGGAADVAVWTFAAPAGATAPVLARAGMVRGRLARRAAAPRAGERGLVGGWGVPPPPAAAAAPAAARPDTLTLSAQAVLSERACAAAAGGAGRPGAAAVFCAAPPSPAGPCVGDEGAPLAVFDADTPAGEPTFVGLFQAAAPPAAAACGPSSPAVYTRLSAHVAALAAAVAPYSLSFTG